MWDFKTKILRYSINENNQIAAEGCIIEHLKYGTVLEFILDFVFQRREAFVKSDMT